MAKERVRKLANWKGIQRKNLIAQLRESVRPRGEPQEKFFSELLLRMELSEFATSEKKARGIEAREAATIMGKSWGGTENPATYTPVSILRGQIDKASSQMLLKAGAYLTSPPYKIEVTNDPPDKKYSQPCIGLILADATDWFVGDVLKGISEASQGRYDLIVEVSNYSQRAEAKSIKRLAERVSGMLVVPGNNRVAPSAIESLLSLPCVLIDRYFENVPDLPCVHPADKAAGRFAASYLKGKNCKRILIVDQGPRANEKFSITPLKERQEACNDACLDPDADPIVTVLSQAGTDEKGGFEALRNFEAGGGRIENTDGIFALADHVAVGCQSYLSAKHRGLKIPLISVEGHRFGDYTEPPLVSIKFDNFEMGRLAAEILISKIEGRELPNSVSHPHTLIHPSLLAPSSGAERREETSISVD